jgi:hypothetical protein
MWVLPTPGRAEQGDVGPVGHERQRREVADLAWVEVGLEREVELVDGFVVGQAGELQCVAEPASLTQAEFLFQEQVDEFEVAEAVGLCAGDEGVDGLAEVGQPEAGGVATDPGGDQFTHGWCGLSAGRCS